MIEERCALLVDEVKTTYYSSGLLVENRSLNRCVCDSSLFSHGCQRISWKIQSKRKPVRSSEPSNADFFSQRSCCCLDFETPNQPGKPSETQYWSLVGVLYLFSGIIGYMVAIKPTGEWRFFSWHPFLMTMGMVGFMGVGAVTKKLGGYDNTKAS